MAHKNHNRIRQSVHTNRRSCHAAQQAAPLSTPEKMLIAWYRTLEGDNRTAIDYWAETGGDTLLIRVQLQRDPDFAEQAQRLIDLSGQL